jgi:heterotetrameric sarcosine oxidase gamma subunit
MRQSALAHLGLAARARADAGRVDAGGVLSERAERGPIVVRGDGASVAFVDAVRAAVGVEPPRTPNTTAGADDPGKGARLLWLAPDEWLLVVGRAAAAGALAALGRALAGEHAAAVDAGDGRAAIGLAGRHAREVLMKGCPLDVDPRAFPVGACAGSTLARAQVVLDHLRTDSLGFPVYDIYVHRSFAEYLWTWLGDAASEYGLRVAED